MMTTATPAKFQNKATDGFKYHVAAIAFSSGFTNQIVAMEDSISFCGDRDGGISLGKQILHDLSDKMTEMYFQHKIKSNLNKFWN